MAGNYVIIERDAEGKAINMRVLDSSGVEVATYGSVKIVIGSDPGTTPASPGTNMGKEIKLRETKGCDNDGNPMYAMMLRSEWYETPLTSDPTT